jgi:hypothetical protein
MSPTQSTPEKSNSVAPGGLAAHSQVIVAADANDVMRDQLDFLIEHAKGGVCGCAHCIRYQRARAVLLEVFG